MRKHDTNEGGASSSPDFRRKAEFELVRARREPHKGFGRHTSLSRDADFRD
jgi:hypothetical protein